MSEPSIYRLIQLLSDLTLVRIGPNGNVTMMTEAARALQSQSAFANKVDSAIRSLFAKKGVPLTAINSAIKDIDYPEVPDAPTIYQKLGDGARGISESQFKRLIFLLACAGGAERSIHVHYSLEGR